MSINGSSANLPAHWEGGARARFQNNAAKMVLIGSEAKREIFDYSLSRYACYLIAQNGDPRKEEIALAQTYFAIQTRKQEVHEQLMEDSKRVLFRDEMKEHNKNLAKAAKEAGVMNYANFQDYGYMGLYAGMRQKNIKANQTHYSVGKKIRQTIQELGGTMPEKLQTPEHIKESKKRLKKQQKSLPERTKNDLPF